ncbi:MAG: hypothetical protein FWF28_00900 [Micrococcales bacterium]|nr:hypothetical protein [Micrococcales bacterium]
MMTTLARPEVHPVTHAFRRMMRTLAPLVAGFWAIVFVAIGAYSAVLVEESRTPRLVAMATHLILVGAPFSMCLAVAVSYLRAHVAGGMTRRTFWRAALAVAAFLAVVNAVLMSILMVCAHLLYAWVTGANASVYIQLHLGGVSWPTQMAAFGTTFLVANVCGFLVGTVFSGLAASHGTPAGTWRATALLPLTAGPVLVVLALVESAHQLWPDRTRAGAAFALSATTAVGLSFAIAILVAGALVIVAQQVSVGRRRA